MLVLERGCDEDEAPLLQQQQRQHQMVLLTDTASSILGPNLIGFDQQSTQLLQITSEESDEVHSGSKKKIQLL